MQRIEVEKRTSAPPDEVWTFLADHEGMKRWMPVREVVRRRPGAPDPNGVGAVRTIRGMGLVIEEEVVAFEPGKRLGYRLTAGAPIRDHAGEVTLTPDGAGTRVRWTVGFRPVIPGTGGLLAFALKRGLAQGLDNLARLAEQSSRA